MSRPVPSSPDADLPSRRPRLPRALVVVWSLLALPALLWLVVVVGTAVGNAGTAHGPDLIRRALLFAALLLAAVATTAAARHARPPSTAGWLTAATAVLLLAFVAPLFLGLFAAGAEEWCEGQPGGRGGPAAAREAEIPVLCR